MTHLSPECFCHWVPERFTLFEFPPFDSTKSPYFYSVCVPPYFISLSSELPPLSFFESPIFVSPNFHVRSGPTPLYFCSLALF